MHQSMNGVFAFQVKIGPEALALAAKFVLLALAVASPIFFLGPMCGNHPFLKAGLFFGVLCAVVSVLNFLFFEKSEIVLRGWYLIVPAFAFAYFLLGFVSGGLLGLLGSKFLP